MLKRILIDVLCTGIALVIFALFHHVLPRQQQSLNIVIPNPLEAQQENTSGALPAGWAEESEAAEDTEDTDDTEKTETLGMLAAGTSVTDSGSRMLGMGRKQQGGGKQNRSGGGMNSKGGSALEDDAASEEDTDPQIEESDDTPMVEKFAEYYTDTVEITENSYSSPNVAITVTEEQSEDGRITYYLADIHVKDITSFRSALAGDTYGSGYRDSIQDMAALNNALLAVNGDYYGNTGEGVVIRNGVIYRANRTNCDVCVLYYDGTMRVMPGSSFSVEEAIQDGAWQAWTFGPALLNTDGSVLTEFSSTGRIIAANPRTAIGYYEPGHYCIVVVDGRGESAGITLPDLSQLFYDLGCTAAYNLDGGNSSVMVWQNAVINDPSGGGRESSDALLIAEVNGNE